MNAPQDQGYFTVGVTGHIDHGKTTLTERLSGKNTDTHPEEKRRGITIDLGFAEFTVSNQRFALIDAPGHTRYIGNLLAGVANLDIAMLIVAADQGIQAQTIEHAAILKGMGVSRLVVVVTRIDLSDAKRLDELDEELLLFLSEVGYEDFPICHCSAKTDQGIEGLLETLQSLAATVTRSEARAELPTRLPVDRVLRVEGRGWVAAGTLFDGRITVGDSLTLAGHDTTMRVRSIEQHSQSVETAEPGYRTAVNLVGEIGSISRGDELLAVDGLATTDDILVQVNLFNDAPSLKLPSTAQLHSATSTCDASLLGSSKDFRTGILRIRTKTPIVAQFGQSILLRQPYPVGTLASGIVVADMNLLQNLRFPSDQRVWNRWRKARIQQLDSPPEFVLANKLRSMTAPKELLTETLEYCNVLEADEASLSSFYALVTDDYSSAYKQLSKQDNVKRIGSRLISSAFLTWLADQASIRLRHGAESSGTVHRTNSAQTGSWLPATSLEQSLAEFTDARIASEAVKLAIKEQKIATAGQFVAPPEFATQLTKKQSQILEQFAESINCMTPPATKELAKEAGIPAKEATQLLKILQSQDRAIPVGTDFFFSTEQFFSLAEITTTWLREDGAATVSEIRDKLQLTRKYVVPLLETFDRKGLTIRSGDQRTVSSSANERLEELR